jgi:tRNA1(Val) A37 N6-methylase TrmN6
LYQPLDGYCYNSDTHFLYDFIEKNLLKYKNITGSLLDIGSGSGILGILLARDYKKLNLYQVEIQKIFQFLTQKNCTINHINSELYKGSLFDIEFDRKFDYVVSNPPFYNSDVIKSENKNIKIARYNDNIPLDKFISTASSLLTQKGKFFFCYDPKQLADIFIGSKKANLNVDAIRYLHPNDKKEASLVMVYCRKNSKSKLQILSPLIMFDKNGNLTQEVSKIYNHTATHSIKAQV